jgi:integrase/recombinase XerD
VFLVQKRVEGCSAQTLRVYEFWLRRFARSAERPDVVAVSRFLSNLRAREVSEATVHQAYRTLKTFARWCVAQGVVDRNPFADLRLRTPKTLPHVPTDAEVRALAEACGEGGTGVRNRCLVLVMADAGLRAAEVCNLLVEDWTPGQRSLLVRCGKGAKDRVVFVSPVTARALKAYLATRRLAGGEEHLFATEDGRRLTPRFLVHLCHKLSRKAGLPPERRVHPHGLRHFAATSWLRNGVGLDETRRLLGHTTLNTTLRYSSLVSADLQRAHRKAAAVERLGLK